MKNQLYAGDNGRIFCEACAGMAARSSGMKRDRAGTKILKITPADQDYWIKEFGEPMECEGFRCK